MAVIDDLIARHDTGPDQGAPERADAGARRCTWPC